ncbi:peptidase domain-containing ABC transporter [Pedobacter sp. JY14-1]|uniref:peptidase domain-containing ABC transporter n=1 Tax=Pedobacter sp. JY14-1 TaxID=3034151 RepID=UPI0023E2C3EF|nr:peptidase domain-containing ABC transporter [Pedobacter sp. JY14-1]
MKGFIFYRQNTANECGLVCLKMIFQYWGRYFNIATIRQKVRITSKGLSILQITDAIEKFHCRTLVTNLKFDHFQDSPLPCIVPWGKDHFVVLLDVNLKSKTVKIADPNSGIRKLSTEKFKKEWSEGAETGTGIFLEPSPRFYNEKEDAEFKLSDFLKFLLPNKSFLFQLFIGLLINFLLALVVPFFAQTIIDTGIKNNDLNYIYVILAAQFILFLSRNAIDMLRNWIVLHLSYRVNLSSVSDFIKRVLNLPINYYSSYSIGDLLRRMEDYSRIEAFISNATLNTIFSLFTGIVFAFVLISFNYSLFIVFLVFNIINVAYQMYFLKKRKILDHKMFKVSTENSSKTIEIMNNALDIKVLNIQREERMRWEELQYRAFGLSKEQTIFNQKHSIGVGILEEVKNILITLISAKLVIEGKISLGMMFSVQYILGQVQGSFSQVIGLMYGYQDAKISLERLSDINDASSEEEVLNGKLLSTNYNLGNLPIKIENLSFKYDDSADQWTLEDISLFVKENSFVAIVGLSGSGKSTLLKILMKLYKPSKATVTLGHYNFYSISNENWRSHCSSVLQESSIFNMSVAENIAINGEIDFDKVVNLCKVVNLDEFIENLPQAYDTLIGGENLSLSQGQKQRLLIARALYSNPKYLFLDEATNALDSFNERQILTNIKSHRSDITIIAVAHRLSTIKDADKIVVLENGKILEEGTHEELITHHARYSELYKLQTT